MEKLYSYIKSILILLCVSLIIISCSSPENRAAERIEAFIAKSGTVGLSVAVVKDNKLIYTGAFGKSSIEKNISMQTDDIFRIASISKSFTTTALMTLVDKKLISPDQDVSELIGFEVRNPKYPDVPVTVQMLLSHSSSLNDSQGYFTLDILNPATNSGYAKCYNEYMPGTGYQYCNLGFNTLGAIVEKVSGIRFDKYVKQVITEPLGLNASFNPDDFQTYDFASLYNADSSGYILSVNAYLSRTEDLAPEKYMIGYSAPLFSPTGGLKISAPDLAWYMTMHMNYGIDPETGVRIISEDKSQLMQTPIIATGEEGSYCMGLNISVNIIPGERMTGHTGSAYGLFSAMYFEPVKKFGIVMMTNGTSQEYGTYVEGFAPVQRDVVRILYEEFIK